ncbi:hypothetical protein Tco_1221159, partial [Tanacetum coccineum]
MTAINSLAVKQSAKNMGIKRITVFQIKEKADGGISHQRYGSGRLEAQISMVNSVSVYEEPSDGSRELKQGMHPRSLPDVRSRTNDLMSS